MLVGWLSVMAVFSVVTCFYTSKGLSCVVIVVFGMVLSNLRLPGCLVPWMLVHLLTVRSMEYDWIRCGYGAERKVSGARSVLYRIVFEV